MGAGMSSFRWPRGFVFDPSSYRWPHGFVFDLKEAWIPLLGLQVAYEYGRPGSDRPPVTAALLAVNVLIFLRPEPLDGILPRINDIALNYQLFLKLILLENFFLSPFYHLNESHLFNNMTALLWMGVNLESYMGSAEFASMVAALLGLSQGISVLLSKGLCLFGNDIPYYDYHTIGFSGVLFGMKAVLSALLDMRLAGTDIPAKYVVWGELFLTQALVPNTSFLCHLGGLLAGHVYLWLKPSFQRKNPLTLLISGGARVLTSQVTFAQKLLRSVLPQGHIIGQGRVGCHSSARECPRGLWRCSTCTNYNSLATDVCEVCSTMREDCAFRQRQQLSVEELHRRRMDKLDR